MLHVVPDQDKVEYAHALIRSVNSLAETDAFVELDDHDLDMTITSLELAYMVIKGVLHVRDLKED